MQADDLVHWLEVQPISIAAEEHEKGIVLALTQQPKSKPVGGYSDLHCALVIVTVSLQTEWMIHLPSAIVD